MNTGLMTDEQVFSLLKDAGIRTPKTCLAKSAQEACTAAENTGYPVVLKISSPDISHKSDVGGVITDIKDKNMLLEAYESVIKNAMQNAKDATIEGVLVSEQIMHKTELFIGGTTDPAFGKVISFGTGGTLVELWKDISFRLTPLDQKKVTSMISDTKISAVLKGFRGAPPLSTKSLEETILKAARIFEEQDEIVSFDMNPVLLGESDAVCVDARFITDYKKETSGAVTDSGVKKPLSGRIFRPETIAVAGASPVPGKIGYYVMQNLLEFEGHVFPVNPNRDLILGRTAYKKVSDIGVCPDWLIVCVPAAKVREVLEDAGEAGVRFAVIISAGFKETGSRGEMLEKEITETARRYKMRIAGPNCLGIMIPREKINATFGPSLPKPGPVAFISQSGAIISAVTDRDITGDVGLSAVISAGNQADIRFTDYLHAVAEDDRTKAAVLYIEELVSGREFLKDVRDLIGRCPVVAIKSGRSKKGSAAARSHTGSLAGRWEIYKEAFSEAGIISASSVTQAFQTAGLLASEGWPKGRRAVVVTSAGGFAVLSADYAEDNGIELIEPDHAMKEDLNSVLPPGWSGKNPIDMIGDANAERYAKTLDVLIRHRDKWDIAYIAAAPLTSIDPVRLAKEIVRFSRQTDGMVVGCLIGGESMRAGIKILNESHIPNFSELEDAFSATGRCVKTAYESGFFENEN